jgi:hypothetical protein
MQVDRNEESDPILEKYLDLDHNPKNIGSVRSLSCIIQMVLMCISRPSTTLLVWDAAMTAERNAGNGAKITLNSITVFTSKAGRQTAARSGQRQK